MATTATDGVHQGVLVTLGSTKGGVGKSTLVGHLLHLLHRRPQVGSTLTQANTKFSFIVDREKEERFHHSTIRGAMELLRLQNGSSLTVIDTPGSPKYLNSALAAFSMADYALVVVSAAHDDAEGSTGFRGATRELLISAYSLGIRHLVVAVNRLPPGGDAEERFNEVKDAMERLLKKISFIIDNVAFVPVDAFAGHNLVTPAQTVFPWFRGWTTERAKGGPSCSGVTLVEALQDLRTPPQKEALLAGPLRLSVFRTFPHRKEGTICIGRVLSGVLRPGAEVTVSPSGLLTKVKTLELHRTTLAEATCGQVVSLHLPDIRVRGTRPPVTRGSLISETAGSSARNVRSFTARVKLLLSEGIQPGGEYILHFHTHTVCCILTNVLEATRDGGVVVNPYKVDNRDTSALMEFTTMAWCVVLPFAKVPALGGFVITSNRKIAAAGCVKTVCPGFITTMLPFQPSFRGHNLTDLPDDCWYSILSYVNEDDLLSLGMTCRRLLHLTGTPHVWKAHYKRRQARTLRQIAAVPRNAPFDYRLSYLGEKNARKLWHLGGHGTEIQRRRVVVAGLAGSGKTSLMNALRFYTESTHSTSPKDLLTKKDDRAPRVQSVLIDSSAEILFLETHGKNPSIIHNLGQHIDAVIYCVDQGL